MPVDGGFQYASVSAATRLPLIAVPILIHLINLRRQQRIRWAAMQFLLESQRRNRRWILLKQLLLLATRMGIIAVLVLMLAAYGWPIAQFIVNPSPKAIVHRVDGSG